MRHPYTIGSGPAGSIHVGRPVGAPHAEPATGNPEQAFADTKCGAPTGEPRSLACVWTWTFMNGKRLSSELLVAQYPTSYPSLNYDKLK